MAALHCALFVLLTHSTLTSSESSLPSSCIGRPDGYQWLKPLEGEEYPPINQLCSDGYMVIDVARDDNVKHYLSSHEYWHYALSGPARMDPANWEECAAADGRPCPAWQCAHCNRPAQVEGPLQNHRLQNHVSLLEPQKTALNSFQ